MDITDKFLKLAPEKQQRILNAAFKEFADQGYNNASTNSIVKGAGIGKGMLFYYFKSKKDLFNYLIDYAINYVMDEYLNQIPEGEMDFIEEYKQAAQIKMRAYAKHPDIFNFLGTFYVNEEVELSTEIKEKLEKARKLGFSKLYSNIDTSLFRNDIESEKIIELISLTMNGYENKLINSLKGKKLSSTNLDPYWKEFDDFLELLRKVYYK